jgi:S1-C subfamily serine protease
MPANTAWELPAEVQPKPGDYSFDLDAALTSVVGLKAQIPEDAFTASVLGTEREGSAVVIRPDGLVLTVGYLITEAETVWLTSADGRAIQGHALAYDFETGFGLVQALGRLNLPALSFGDPSGLEGGERVILAAEGGRRHALEARVAGRREFAGYWEYLIEGAIFTVPAHPAWSGGALIGEDGRLLGIGSLILQGETQGTRRDMNMVVPINLLPPILDDLLSYGRPNRAARPWLGLYAADTEDGVVVAGLADGGPAEQAGVRAGDQIVAIGDGRISDLGSFWRMVWARGSAGVEVPLRLSRDERTVEARLQSADRASFLRRPNLH